MTELHQALATRVDGWRDRIPDAIISAAARHADVDFIATFDEKLRSPLTPVRML